MFPLLPHRAAAALFRGLLLLAAAGMPPATPAAEPTPADPTPVFLATGFDEPGALDRWSGPGRIEPGRESPGAVTLHVAPPDGAAVVSVPLPVEAMRGHLVRVTAQVRARAVTAPPQSWNGIKCMLAVESPGRNLWPQARAEAGTFDWRRLAFTARIPPQATSARLVLGLERVAGQVWFDEVRVVSARPPVPRPLAGASAASTSPPDVPRLRGVMISPGIDAEGLRVLGREWGANLIRWQLVRPCRPGEPSDPATFDAWLEGELGKLDAALPHCRAHGLRIALDLHSPPGGRGTSGGYAGSDDRLFSDPACQAKFVKVWEQLAARYRGTREIWGFDLANEPVEECVEDGCDDWQGLAERATRALRVLDPDRTVIVEPASWGGPDGLLDLVPLPLPNVVYSVHMYLPHAFTHQGVHGPGPAWTYPGVIEGRAWDKAQLEAALRPVIEFQRRHGTRIYLGEFSAIRWAPGDSAVRYLGDLLDLFEAHGWDWSYHAFREWHGWSVEHGPDRNDTRPAPEPTDRQRLLRRAFARNTPPAP